MKGFYVIVAAALIYMVWHGMALYKEKERKEFWIFVLLSAASLYYFVGSKYVWNLFHPMLYVKDFTEPLSRWMIQYLFGVKV